MTRLLADGKRLTLWAGSALAALVEKPAATKIICARLQQPLVAGCEYAFRALHRLNLGPTYMSYGKDERHFDKHIWQLPIPKFDPSNPMHNELARLCKTLHSLAAKFSVDVDLHFAATRRHFREQIEASEAGIEVNEMSMNCSLISVAKYPVRSYRLVIRA